MKAEISFACFSGGMHSNSFLFARTEFPMKRGETTSDYLAFFGFGSGYNFDYGKVYPKWLDGMRIYDLPCVSNDLRFILNDVAHLVKAYSERGYLLDRFELKRLLSVAIRMGANSNVASSAMLDNILTTMLPRDDSKLSMAPTVFIYGVDVTGRYYVKLALPDLDIGFGSSYLLASEHDIHEWKTACNVGGPEHVQKIVNGLNKHANFLSGPQDLKRLSSQIAHVYPLILI